MANCRRMLRRLLAVLALITVGGCSALGPEPLFEPPIQPSAYRSNDLGPDPHEYAYRSRRPARPPYPPAAQHKPCVARGSQPSKSNRSDGSTSSSIEGQRGSNPRDCARAIE